MFTLRSYLVVVSSKLSSYLLDPPADNELKDIPQIGMFDPPSDVEMDDAPPAKIEVGNHVEGQTSLVEVGNHLEGQTSEERRLVVTSRPPPLPR